MNIPSDLYDCNVDSDCVLMNKNFVKNECCEWDAINIKYRDWYYQEMNEKLKCDHTCPDSLLTEAVCINSKCEVRLVSSNTENNDANCNDYKSGASCSENPDCEWYPYGCDTDPSLDEERCYGGCYPKGSDIQGPYID